MTSNPSTSPVDQDAYESGFEAGWAAKTAEARLLRGSLDIQRQQKTDLVIVCPVCDVDVSHRHGPCVLEDCGINVP